MRIFIHWFVILLSFFFVSLSWACLSFWLFFYCYISVWVSLSMVALFWLEKSGEESYREVSVFCGVVLCRLSLIWLSLGRNCSSGFHSSLQKLLLFALEVLFLGAFASSAICFSAVSSRDWIWGTRLFRCLWNQKGTFLSNVFSDKPTFYFSFLFYVFFVNYWNGSLFFCRTCSGVEAFHLKRFFYLFLFLRGALTW